MLRPTRAARAAAARKTLRAAGVIPPPTRLRLLREALEETLATVAGEMGVSDPAVNEWEKDKRTPSGVSPHLIEAWSRKAAAKLGVPERTIFAVEWLTPAEREQVAAVPIVPSSDRPEAA